MRKFRCECCGEYLTQDNFYKDDRREFGLKLDACKNCRKLRYQQNRDNKINYQKKWNNEHQEEVRSYVYKHILKKKSLAL